jgi:RimJ/RimL family protein N-acetyltransferase
MLKMIPALQTSRLVLRPLELADSSQTQLLFPQWEIVRYLAKTVPWPYPPDGAYTYYRDKALPAMEREEEWHWTLRLKTDPERLIGSIGLIKNGPINTHFCLRNYHAGFVPKRSRSLRSKASRFRYLSVLLSPMILSVPWVSGCER